MTFLSLVSLLWDPLTLGRVEREGQEGGSRGSREGLHALSSRFFGFFPDAAERAAAGVVAARALMTTGEPTRHAGPPTLALPSRAQRGAHYTPPGSASWTRIVEDAVVTRCSAITCALVRAALNPVLVPFSQYEKPRPIRPSLPAHPSPEAPPVPALEC